MKTEYKRINKFSVVHFGPIKYFKNLQAALLFARAAIRRGWFRCDGRAYALKTGETLTIYDLDKDDVAKIMFCN